MKTDRPIPEPISRLRKRVDAWRAKRTTRGPMPEPLWSEAGTLAGKYGIYTVSRGARLAYDGVKKRISTEAVVSRPVSPAQSLARPFVELSVSSLSGGQVHEVAVVELRDARGRSLSVRMMPQALLQMQDIVTTLWGLS